MNASMYERKTIPHLTMFDGASNDDDGDAGGDGDEDDDGSEDDHQLEHVIMPNTMHNFSSNA